MGLFNKKLDYSSGKGILPKVSLGDYSDLTLPNTSMIRVPNLNLMTREKAMGNLEKVFGASVEAYFAKENESNCLNTIEKYLGGLRSRMAPNLENEGTQLLAKFIGIGCGMAIVEAESGLMEAGKCHPSITNVSFRLTTNLGPEHRILFKDVPVYQQLIEIAVQVGYVATRLGNSVSLMKCSHP